MGTSVRHSRFLVNNTIALLLSVIALSVVVGTGILRAFTRGGSDFAVFYKAWQLVLEGRGAEVYQVSPDRFLYSPGFAWVLAPFAWWNPNIALGLWCALKVVALVGILYSFVLSAARLGPSVDRQALWIGSLIGMLAISKPLLIDFEYGQVNIFVLAACVFALVRHGAIQGVLSPLSLFCDFVTWVVLAFVACGKLFPLPLLCVPWVVTRQIPHQQLRVERWGIVLGCFLALCVPVFTVGAGIGLLLQGWVEALLARGLPLESHNQSFIALLHHFFSGTPTPVRANGSQPILFGTLLISFEQIGLLARAWTFATLGLCLGWLVAGDSRSRDQKLAWMAVLIGFLIVPSHLVWKPYFVMSAPLLILLGQRLMMRIEQSTNCLSECILFTVIFLGINFTGFDFIGGAWGAYVEAASFLLIIHVILMARVANLDSVRASEVE